MPSLSLPHPNKPGQKIRINLPDGMSQIEQDQEIDKALAEAGQMSPVPTRTYDPNVDREQQLLRSRAANLAAAQKKGYQNAPLDSARYKAEGEELGQIRRYNLAAAEQKPYEDINPAARSIFSLALGVGQPWANASGALRAGVKEVTGKDLPIGPSEQYLKDVGEIRGRMTAGDGWNALLANTGSAVSVLPMALAGPNKGAVLPVLYQGAVGAAAADPGSRAAGATWGAGGYMGGAVAGKGLGWVWDTAKNGWVRPTGAGADLAARHELESVITPGMADPGSLAGRIESGLANTAGKGGDLVRKAQGRVLNTALERETAALGRAAGAEPLPDLQTARRGPFKWLRAALGDLSAEEGSAARQGTAGRAYDRTFNAQVEQPGQVSAKRVGPPTRITEPVPGTAGEADHPIFQGRDVAEPVYQPGDQLVEGYPTKSLESRGHGFEGSISASKSVLDPQSGAVPRLSGAAEAEEAAFLADQGIPPPEMTPGRTGTYEGPTVQGSIQHARGSAVEPWDGRITPAQMAELEGGDVPPPRLGAPQYAEVTIPNRTPLGTEPNTTRPALRNTQVRVPTEVPGDLPELAPGATGEAGDNAALLQGQQGLVQSTPTQVITPDVALNRAVKVAEGTGLTDLESRAIQERWASITRKAQENPTWENWWQARSNLRDLIRKLGGKGEQAGLIDLERTITADLERGMDPALVEKFRAQDTYYRWLRQLEDSATRSAPNLEGPAHFDARALAEVQKEALGAEGQARGLGQPDRALVEDLETAYRPVAPSPGGATEVGQLGHGNETAYRFKEGIFKNALADLLYSQRGMDLALGRTGWQQALQAHPDVPLLEQGGRILKRALPAVFDTMRTGTDRQLRLTPPNLRYIPDDEFKETP